MTLAPFTFRNATAADLPALNKVIASAVMNWPMAHRVKRLSLPVLQYDATDLDHMQIHVCEHGTEIIGVAAFDANPGPESQGLLHGLYVLPVIQRHGIGRALMERVFESARTAGLNAVAIRAERVSESFFASQDLLRVAPANDADYPWQFVKPLDAAA